MNSTKFLLIKTNFFSFLFFISMICPLVGQTVFEPIPDSIRTIIFHDNFADNSNNWPINLANSQVKIKKGVYSRAFNSKPIVEDCGIIVDIPDSSDFKIIAEINFPKDWFNFHSIIFGASNKDDKPCYTFGLNNSEGEGKDCSLMFGEASVNGFFEIGNSGIKRYKINEYNEIRIRCIKNVFYFYINREFAFYSRRKKFFGNVIGIGSWGTRTPTTVKCESLEVAIINSK